LINAAHNVKAEYARNGSFILSRSTLARIRKMQDGEGQYVFQPGVYAMGVGSNILGHPIVECTDMPAISNGSVPVVFGDFRRGYMIVDRTTLSIMRDPFTQANTGNVRYIARRRVGGQVILDEALTKITIQ
jgi:HK97 family phage major capsid protein